MFTTILTHSRSRNRNQPVPTAALPYVDPEPHIELGRLPTPLVGLDAETGNSDPPTPWLPKVTVYRLAFNVVTVGLGTAKFMASISKSRSGSFLAITFEWVSGIVIFLIAYFLGQYYEAKDTAWPYWLFRADIMNGVRKLFRSVGIKIPRYNTEAPNLEFLIKPKHPPITGYRILVTASAIIFGMTKAVCSYIGLETAPSTVEWLYGVAITLSIYWLGFFEASANEVMPWLFIADYSPQVVFATVKLSGLATVGLLSYLLYLGLDILIRYSWQPRSGHTQEPAPSPLTVFDVVIFARGVTLVVVIPIGSLGFGGGMVAVYFILNSFNRRFVSWIFKIKARK
ncbi:hypothetical protein EST38_g13806 [Candolleomyces aberdarensis]|uniref:Uncharacterized protein n=1 Tax=Candolleomyces aberdarensis TaxID=2316362 RepID=A0A4V1Q1L9_9AGAR|nr:hypothetical protein EST38_g13806 [Candolleomyces aberdarensis]